jgi:hypothetical protein
LRLHPTQLSGAVARLARSILGGFCGERYAPKNVCVRRGIALAACCGRYGVGRRPTSLQGRRGYAAALGGESRSKGSALTGSAPHPPRGLSLAVGRRKLAK